MTNGILINQTIELTRQNILDQLQGLSETEIEGILGNYQQIEFDDDLTYESVTG